MLKLVATIAAGLSLAITLTGCITIQPQPSIPSPEESDGQSDGNESPTVIVVSEQSRATGNVSGADAVTRQQGRAQGRVNRNDVTMTGIQPFRIQCTDAESDCIGVWIYLRRDSGPQAGRAPDLIGALSVRDDDSVFGLEYDTRDKDNGNYTVIAIGCDETLNLNEGPPIQENEACTTVEKAGRIRN